MPSASSNQFETNHGSRERAFGFGIRRCELSYRTSGQAGNRVACVHARHEPQGCKSVWNLDCLLIFLLNQLRLQKPPNTTPTSSTICKHNFTLPPSTICSVWTDRLIDLLAGRLLGTTMTQTTHSFLLIPATPIYRSRARPIPPT